MASAIADLNPLDVFLWGHIKSLVYEIPVEFDVILLGEVQAAGNIWKSATNFIRRCNAHFEISGRHFEQLLWAVSCCYEVYGYKN